MAGSRVWYLEQYHVSSGGLSRLEVDRFPFQVGRDPELDLTLRDKSVSRLHAELLLGAEGLLVKDRESTNGTWVNRCRVEAPVTLGRGDIVHFGDIEFRVGCEDLAPELAAGDQTVLTELPLPAQQLPAGSRELLEMLENGSVGACLQPIVVAASGEVHGFELLGRGADPRLSTSPAELLAIAESLGVARELSELFRREGVRRAAAGAPQARLFVNAHPIEMRDPPRLVNDLASLLGRHPDLTLVLEIHERAVADLGVMAQVHGALRELGIALAYDDFGAGESRLQELVNVPPDYIKLDKSLVAGLDHAADRQRSLIDMILELAGELDIRTLAEGVSSAAEVAACRDAGFDFLQGFEIGAPEPLPATTGS
jgi:EAL domain-containing protein (putative c-di-GMP-specific phosphodiesterase class I)